MSMTEINQNNSSKKANYSFSSNTRERKNMKSSLSSFNPYTSRVIDLGKGHFIGGGHFQTIAGPCSVEGNHIFEIASLLKSLGVSILRGGAFKPRTSPESFQGLGKEGLDLLACAGRENDMLTISEIMSERDIDLYRDIDILQVGARNCQNYSLLKALGKVDKPILLKRGMATTIDELIGCALYITQAGNERVILCERGIRTFEPRTRNTFDVSSIPLLHENCDFPIVADPSHATGLSSLVASCALAAMAAGADGIQIEVHENPQLAKSDKDQALTLGEFKNLMHDIESMHEFLIQN